MVRRSYRDSSTGGERPTRPGGQGEELGGTRTPWHGGATTRAFESSRARRYAVATAAAVILFVLFALACGEPHDAPSVPSPIEALIPSGSLAGSAGVWVDRDQLAGQPVSGAAWGRLEAEARRTCGMPRLSDQNDRTNVCVMAKALVAARTENPALRADVIEALRALVRPRRYAGRALALGRELIAYVIAADLIDLRSRDPRLDRAFRDRIATLVTTPTSDGPRSLVDCHERRPNNWGTHCGASRAAVAAYLGNRAELARVATVFKGYLGDRSSYAGFTFGDLSWQCDAARPVGVNPRECTKAGHSIDGVLPDDQRRGGAFRWPPPQENYVYEGLQGALAQAIILHRAGYDAFNWEDRALLRAFEWLHREADFPAQGDDAWQPHIVNYFYRTSFPAQVPARPGKNVGWSDWTHGQ